MPYPNEHAYRIREPGEFEERSFRRTTRDHDGKSYSVIMGKLKGGDGTMVEQAYRYPADSWTAEQARKHAHAHAKGRFEPATGEKVEALEGVVRQIVWQELERILERMEQ